VEVARAAVAASHAILLRSSVTNAPCDVRFTPESGRITDIGRCLKGAKSCREQMQQNPSLFDHLVGGQQQVTRNFQIKRSGRVEIHDKLVFVGCSIGFAPMSTTCVKRLMPRRRAKL
jgi:hypothetical protein